jgi:hypothetical protein
MTVRGQFVITVMVNGVVDGRSSATKKRCPSGDGKRLVSRPVPTW